MFRKNFIDNVKNKAALAVVGLGFVGSMTSCSTFDVLTSKDRSQPKYSPTEHDYPADYFFPKKHTEVEERIMKMIEADFLKEEADTSKEKR